MVRSLPPDVEPPMREPKPHASKRLTLPEIAVYIGGLICACLYVAYRLITA